MYQKTYYIDKSTDTFADVLSAYGLGTILMSLVSDHEEMDIRLRDDGAVYALELEQPLAAAWVEQGDYFKPVPFILTDKIKQKNNYPDDMHDLIDYEAEKRWNAEYYEARKLLSKEASRPGATPDEYPELRQLKPPKPDWPVWAMVNQMSALPAYNGMVEAWHEAKAYFPDMLKILLRLYAQSPNDLAGAISQWKDLAKAKQLRAKPMAAATQVYNPATGKGANRAKASALSIGGQNNFWLLEYLKLVGLPQAGIPRTVRGAKDRKTYVLLPVNITIGTSQKIFRQFQQVLWSNSAIKMDIVAALKYTQVFLDQWQADQLNNFERMLIDGQPGNHVSGLALAFYKDLGSAHAVLNQSTINLPRWLKQVETKGEAILFLALLEEHQRIINMLDESRSLEYELLRTYRDFLSSGSLADFFEFTALYSRYLTQKIEGQTYVQQFTTNYLEILVSNKDEKLKPILDNPGFQRIAYAIRQSTVNAQWAKIRDKRVYDIRYGLGSDLKRKANYNDEFVQTLTDFIHLYNQETVQMAERYDGDPPRRRAMVTTDDLNQIVELIDLYGSKTIGNMLVVFGYARTPKELQEDQPNDSTPTDND